MKKTLTIFALLITAFLFGQRKDLIDVNLDHFIGETQFTSENSGSIEMFWWIPTEYWKVVFLQDGSSEEEMNEFIEVIEDYLVLGALKGKLNFMGFATFEPESSVKSHLEVNYKGTKLEMVDPSEWSYEVAAIFGMFKPILSSIIGNMGENLHFFLYKNPDSQQALPIDLYSNDVLEFKMDGYAVEVDLPLSCLLVEKICPTDQKLYSGKWNYCPIHGVKLK